VPKDRTVLDDVDGRDRSGVDSGVRLAELRSCQLVSPALMARSCSSADLSVERRVLFFGREGTGDFAGVEAGDGVLRRGTTYRDDMEATALTGPGAAWDSSLGTIVDRAFGWDELLRRGRSGLKLCMYFTYICNVWRVPWTLRRLVRWVRNTQVFGDGGRPLLGVFATRGLTINGEIIRSRVDDTTHWIWILPSPNRTHLRFSEWRLAGVVQPVKGPGTSPSSNSVGCKC
jgi:hypothetical protein